MNAYGYHQRLKCDVHVSQSAVHVVACGLQSQLPVLQVKELRDAGCEAQAIQCDVSVAQQQEEAFQMHMQQFRRLDIAILNAGIGDKGQLCYGAPCITSPLPVTYNRTRDGRHRR